MNCIHIPIISEVGIWRDRLSENALQGVSLTMRFWGCVGKKGHL